MILRSLVRLVGIASFAAGAIAVVRFASPTEFLTAPFAAPVSGNTGSALRVVASGNAFGRSGDVKLRTAMPGESLEFPLEVSGGVGTFTYRWVPVRPEPADPLDRRLLTGSSVAAPHRPGIYRLALQRNGAEQIVAEPLVAVLVPFESKRLGVLNGYRIGTYLAERVGGDARPRGFVEVYPEMADLAITRHLRLADFITHDAQRDVWPKYVALDMRLLDKLELVFGRVAGWQGARELPERTLEVSSGFRTPAHNAGVRRSARDSRHQYGDAADIQVDVNRDGQMTAADEVLLARAVEEIEAEHPDLAGGLGRYTSRRFRAPYVHIDARGKRSRWRG